MTVLLEVSQGWSIFHIAVVFLLLFRSKYSLRRTLISIFVICAVLSCIGIGLLKVLGWENSIQVAALTCSIPSLFLFYLLSEYRDGRFFFTFCLSDTACIWLIQATNLLDRLCGDTYVVLFVSRLLLFPLFELLLWKVFRRPYLEIQRTLPGGWWMFTAIAGLFYLLLLLTAIPAGVTAGDRNLAILLALLALMPITYFSIFAALHRQMLYYEALGNQNLLSAQVSGLQGRIAATQAAEEALRIERHDLRHKLLAMEDLIERGEKAEALAYIHTLQGETEYAKPERWCANPLLDAVFSSYFSQAKRLGIRIEAKLALPEELPVNPAELSTVFANALENALHACAAVPEEQREIRCTCISRPTLMFGIANPYTGEIRFDKAGLPVACDPGHGIGTRSIAAFCQKHGAHCVYEAKDGWFRLKIAL